MIRFALAAAAVLMFAWEGPALAAVADYHVKKGVACEACHGKETAPAANVTEQPCIKCHGETPAGKPLEIEGKKVPNIHAGHFDAYECLVCHKGHKQSVLACVECHRGSKLAVP